MRTILRLTYIALLVILSSCSTVQKNYKYSFADGYYKSKIFDEKKNRVYVQNKNDSIIVYAIDEENNTSSGLKSVLSLMPEEKTNLNLNSLVFRHTSADIDFLTILSKRRFKTEEIPGQINTNLNGCFYLGYRNDIYKLKYSRTPLKTYERQMNHFGFSSGFFTGFGGAPVNPYVTANQVSIEYDGVVWIKGFAFIIGIDKARLGFTLGWDHLMDDNKDLWIYQGKPWLGIAIGLNLN